MACLSACSQDVTPMITATCSVVTKPGGIMCHGVMKCDASFDDVSGGSITDVATWTELKEQGKIIFSGQIVGSMAAGSPTKTRVASCKPEQTTGSQKVISTRDYNSDPENLTEYDFYNEVQANDAALKYFCVTCDELVYLYEDGKWSGTFDEVRPETNEEPTHIAGTITVTELGIKKPVKVAGISILVGNAA